MINEIMISKRSAGDLVYLFADYCRVVFPDAKIVVHHRLKVSYALEYGQPYNHELMAKTWLEFLDFTDEPLDYADRMRHADDLQSAVHALLRDGMNTNTIMLMANDILTAGLPPKAPT